MGQNPIHVISLGAGVQSSTMALMAAAGEITPMPVAAVFADTHAEPQAVYEWLGHLVAKLKFPVITVSKGNLVESILRRRVNKKTGNPYYSTYIPAFVISGDGRGILRRKCTHDFKVLELIKQQRRLIGNTNMRTWRKLHKDALTALREWEELKKAYKRHECAYPMRPQWAWQECQKDPLAVVWIGISLDEVGRMKESSVPWAVNRFPLIDLQMTRTTCYEWMEKHGHPRPPKSACIFCPYHDDNAWKEQKDHRPEEFAQSVKFEKDFQKICADGGARNIPYLHDSLKPLDEVIFKPNTTKKTFQTNLRFNNECEGMCGV